MISLDRQELKKLIAATRETCVSIYLPTYRAGAETLQGPIRLKNLLREAEGQLRETGVDKDAAEKILAPARRLVDDFDFWQHQSDGLAVFLTPEEWFRYRLPRSFDERVTVGDHFRLKPLMPLLTGDGRFYLLALSQNKVRLFEGTRDSVGEIDLGDTPTSLADALGHDWEERTLQLHTGRGRSPETGVLQGQGATEDDAKEEITQFFNQVDHGVRERLRDPDAPMVLAAVDYLTPIYREVSEYPHILEEGLKGNPDELGAQQLHDRAWPLVEPRFHRAEEEARDRFHELMGTGRASSDLREIVPASHDGRVDLVFVARHTQRWGRFDEDSREIELHDEHRNGDRDLLDYVAVHTLMNGGEVFSMQADEMPLEAEVAAVFRY